MADSHSDDNEGKQTVPVKRPPKNINVFVSDENVGVFAPQVVEGAMGDLPLLISVNVGYDPEASEPFMYHYESDEVMFAFKKDGQRRVLLKDSFQRTLSLPLSSSVAFKMESADREMTVDEIVSSQRLPVRIQFSRPECMEFEVDQRKVDHTYFGTLTLTGVYDEPYLWCLPVHRNGKAEDRPIALPGNLLKVCFCPVVAIKGAADPTAKVKEFLQHYSRLAADLLVYKLDPFFQELAFVSRNATPVDTANMAPYIDDSTFIPIHYKRRPAPLPPQSSAPALPPRTPVRPDVTQEEHYNTIENMAIEEHEYFTITATNTGTRPKVDSDKGSPRGSMDKRDVIRSVPQASTKTDPPPKTGSAAPPLPQRKKSSDSASGVRDSPESPVSTAPLMRPPPPQVTPARERLLKHMSVEQVGQVLKDLGLGKYVKKFNKHRIDGVLLMKLTERAVKDEFKMTHMEFLVLNTFITEGHIPQMDIT